MEISKLIDDWFSLARNQPNSYFPNKEIEFIKQNVIFIELSDGSRNLGDLVTLICMRTDSDGILDIFNGSLLKGNRFIAHFPYEEGFLTDFHSHNYVELSYVVKGQLKQQIIDKDEVFNPGEICLLDKDSKHADYLMKENSVVIFLGIANSFFDDFIMTDYHKYNAERFIRDTIIKRKEKYQFVRCTPKSENTRVYELFGRILMEIYEPQVGTVHLIQGYVERLLGLLPVEYQVSLSPKENVKMQLLLYDDVIAYIHENYQTVSTKKLSEVFGYNRDYFNRLIRHQSGISYTQLVQNIRLEKAEDYLKSTNLSIEVISHRVGYYNLGYFYRVFFDKYHMTPNEYRK